MVFSGAPPKSKILGLKGKDLIASSKRKFTYPFIFKGDNKLKKLLKIHL